MQGSSIVRCALLVLGPQAEERSEPAQKTDPSAAADIVTQFRAEADQLKRGHASHFLTRSLKRSSRVIARRSAASFRRC
jgi:hypothetical protein